MVVKEVFFNLSCATFLAILWKTMFSCFDCIGRLLPRYQCIRNGGIRNGATGALGSDDGEQICANFLRGNYSATSAQNKVNVFLFFKY